MARCYACARHGIGQERLQARRAAHGGRPLHFRALDDDAASCRDTGDLCRDVGHGGIARRVVAGANIEREFAATRNDVDRAVGDGKLPDSAHKRGHLRAALFDVKDELGGCRRDIGTVPAWPAVPVIVTVDRTEPAIALTIPIGSPSSSRTGPCSMWTSRYPIRFSRRRASPGILAGSSPASRMTAAKV